MISIKRLSCLVFVTLISFVSYPLTLHKESTSFDVIVAGSDPEGISAAVAASRSGCRVLLIDTRSYVGGLYTSGMLSMLDMNYKDSNSMDVVNEGFFSEFYKNVGRAGNIDIFEAKYYFETVLKQNKVKVESDIDSFSPLMSGNRITGITYTKDGKVYNATSSIVIDASPDAQISRAVGVPYIIGREDLGLKNRYAAATLVFAVKGVNWGRVTKYLNSDDSIYTGATTKVAWGYENMVHYKPSSDRFQLRKLNLSFQNDKSVVINAFQIFDVDPLSPISLYDAYYCARSELPHIINFLRENAYGFENAYLCQVANELYIREGVRIVGENTLTGEDIFTNRDFPNKIAYGSYPADLQSTSRDFSGGSILTGRNIYTIPLGVIIPKGVDNLLTVGRSASYDSIAHSSARTVPVGMSVAQAAGVTASYCISKNITPRVANLDMAHIKQIQKRLEHQGVNFSIPIPNEHPEKDSWAYPYIVRLRSSALLSKEYQYKNDYRCKEHATYNTIERILELTEINSDIPVPAITQAPKSFEPMTQKDLLNIINQILGSSYTSFEPLYSKKIIDQTTYTHLTSKEELLNEHLYAVMDQILFYIRAQNNLTLPTLSEIIHQDPVVKQES